MIVDCLDGYGGTVARYDGEPWRAKGTVLGARLGRVGAGWMSRSAIMRASLALIVSPTQLIEGPGDSSR